MAEKLLKKKARKVAPKKAPVEEAKGTVLVGTYKEKQLAWIKRHGVYNYPVKEGDEFDTKAFAAVKELWLYADAKGTRHTFESEFVGKMTKAEFLAANPTYAKLGPSSSKAYYVFKTKPLEYGPRLENPIVVVRTADFGGRSAKVKKAIEQFKADGEFAPLEHYLPVELARVPAAQLRVCEAAVQSQHVQWTPVVGTSPVLDKIESIVMSIGEFGRTHSISSQPDHNIDRLYDIVVGFIADDKIRALIRLYRNGLMTKDAVLAALQAAPWRVMQYSFHTAKALRFLKLKEVWHEQ